MEIKIEQSVIDEATNNALTKLLSDDNYQNPVKRILENEFSWDMNGAGKTEFAKRFRLKVEEIMLKLIDDENFHKILGDKITTIFANNCVKDLRNLKERKTR